MMRTYRVESRQQEETRNEAHAGPKRASAREAGEVWDHAAAIWSMGNDADFLTRLLARVGGRVARSGV